MLRYAKKIYTTRVSTAVNSLDLGVSSTYAFLNDFHLQLHSVFVVVWRRRCAIQRSAGPGYSVTPTSAKRITLVFNENKVFEVFLWTTVFRDVTLRPICLTLIDMKLLTSQLLLTRTLCADKITSC